MSPHLPLTPQEWFTVAELAERGLPGLPSTKKGVQLLAAREGWADRTGPAGETLSRKRKGKGGGLEYNMAVLPEAARARLLVVRPATPERLDRDAAWARWERLPEGMRTEARARLELIDRIEQLQRRGVPKDRAVKQVAKDAGCGKSAVYTWFKRIEGVRTDDRAVYLVADYAGREKAAACTPEAWEHYKGYYLRQSKPTADAAYRDTVRVAAELGWTVPSAKSLKRRLDLEVPPSAQTLARGGPKEHAHTYPHLTRKRPDVPMMVGNLDGHLWDVNVLWEDGSRERAQSLVVQDLASSKILGCRFDRSLNANLVRLTLGDVFRDHGLFETIIMDNGRENSAAAIVGGQKTNRRWHQVPEETPDGLLTLLGIKAQFTTPYWGQAKPIERAFRDFAHDIAKRPEFEGAYTGHNTVSKPENNRTRAIPIAEFEALVRREIAFYNAQLGRRGAHMAGRSFDQVFAEGIALRPPRRATPQQLRLCLLASKPVSMDRQSGAVAVEGHRYWSEALSAVKRQRVVVRFDPENLAAPVYVYGLRGQLLAEAARIGEGDFDTVLLGRNQRKAVRDYKRAERDRLDAIRRMTAAQVAAQSARARPPAPAATVTDPKVIAPAFGAPRLPQDLEPPPERRQAAAGGGSTFDFNAAFDRQAQRLVKGGG